MRDFQKTALLYVYELQYISNIEVGGNRFGGRIHYLGQRQFGYIIKSPKLLWYTLGGVGAQYIDLHMTEAFVNAAEAKWHTVTRFDAAWLQVDGCHASEKTYNKEALHRAVAQVLFY